MTTQTERSLVLVKPDGFKRGLSGEVLRRIEAKGYTLVTLDQGGHPQRAEQQADQQHHGDDERAGKGRDLQDPAHRDPPWPTQQAGVQDAQNRHQRTDEQK